MKHPWGNTELLSGIRYTLALNKRQYVAACKMLDVSPSDWRGFDHGATLFFGHGCIVALKGWKKLGENQRKALIVHEAVHVWQFNKERIEEKGEAKEVEAYAIEKISFELFNLFDVLSKGA
jgi:hypothetical protein